MSSYTLDYVEGQINNKISEFLGLKSKIVKAQGDANQGETATELLVQQKYLEGKLSEALATVQSMKDSGDYSVSELTSLMTFYYLMENHINDVNDMLGNTSTSWQDFLPYIIGIGFFGAAYYIMKGNRN